MKNRKSIAVGLGALAVTVAGSVGAYTAVHAQPPGGSPQLPAASILATKLDSLNNPRLPLDVRGGNVSGEGPAPQMVDPKDDFGQKIVVTNNVTEVTEEGPSRLVATRTIKYVFPDGKVVDTEKPGRVPFILEADGEWRVDRAYLCGQKEAIDNLAREMGHNVKPDPGCV